MLLAAWLIRIAAFSGESWVRTAAIGMIPGAVVVAVFYAGATAVAVRPRTGHAKGELRSVNLRQER